MLDRVASALRDKGLMPIRSVRDQDSVVIPTLESMSSESSELLGPWSEVR